MVQTLALRIVAGYNNTTAPNCLTLVVLCHTTSTVVLSLHVPSSLHCHLSHMPPLIHATSHMHRLSRTQPLMHAASHICCLPHPCLALPLAHAPPLSPLMCIGLCSNHYTVDIITHHNTQIQDEKEMKKWKNEKMKKWENEDMSMKKWKKEILIWVFGHPWCWDIIFSCMPVPLQGWCWVCTAL